MEHRENAPESPQSPISEETLRQLEGFRMKNNTIMTGTYKQFMLQYMAATQQIKFPGVFPCKYKEDVMQSLANDLEQQNGPLEAVDFFRDPSKRNTPEVVDFFRQIGSSQEISQARAGFRAAINPPPPSPPKTSVESFFDFRDALDSKEPEEILTEEEQAMVKALNEKIPKRGTGLMNISFIRPNTLRVAPKDFFRSIGSGYRGGISAKKNEEGGYDFSLEDGDRFTDVDCYRFFEEDNTPEQTEELWNFDELEVPDEIIKTVISDKDAEEEMEDSDALNNKEQARKYLFYHGFPKFVLRWTSQNGDSGRLVAMLGKYVISVCDGGDMDVFTLDEARSIPMSRLRKPVIYLYPKYRTKNSSKSPNTAAVNGICALH